MFVLLLHRASPIEKPKNLKSAMLSLRSIFTASGRLHSLRRSIISPLYRNAMNNVTRSFSQLRTSPWTINNLMILRSKGGYDTAKASTTASTTYLLSQTRGMKTRSSVKRLCEGCKVSFFPLMYQRGKLWCNLYWWEFSDSRVACAPEEQGLHYLVSLQQYFTRDLHS